MEHIPSDLSPPDRDLRPPDHSQSALFMLIQTILQLQPARGTYLYFTVAMPSHACNYQSDGRLKVPLRTNSPVALVFVESSAPPVLMASASNSIAQPPHQKAIPIRRLRTHMHGDQVGRTPRAHDTSGDNPHWARSFELACCRDHPVFTAAAEHEHLHLAAQGALHMKQRPWVVPTTHGGGLHVLVDCWGMHRGTKALAVH